MPPFSRGRPPGGGGAVRAALAAAAMLLALLGPRADAALVLPPAENRLTAGVLDAARNLTVWAAAAAPPSGPAWASLVRVATDDWARVDSLPLNGAAAAGGVAAATNISVALLDAGRGLAYFVTLGSPTVVVQLNLGTFRVSAAYTAAVGAMDAVVDGAIDVSSGTRNIAYLLATGGAYARLVRFNLNNVGLNSTVYPLVVGANFVPIPAPEAPLSLLLDTVGLFAYVGVATGGTPGGRIVRFKINTAGNAFTRLDNLTLPAGYDRPSAALLEPASNTGFWATTGAAGVRIIRVNLTALPSASALLGTLVATSVARGMGQPLAAVFDPAPPAGGGSSPVYGYWASGADADSPAQLLRVRLPDLGAPVAVNLTAGTGAVLAAVGDASTWGVGAPQLYLGYIAPPAAAATTAGLVARVALAPALVEDVAPTPTGTPSGTPSRTPTGTGTPTRSESPGSTDSRTGTAAATGTRTSTGTGTGTRTGTPAATATRTSTGTDTPDPSFSRTATASRSASGTRSSTGTSSPTRTATATPSGTTTRTGTPSDTPPPTGTPSRTRTASGTGSRPATPTNTQSPGASPSVSPSWSSSPSVTPSGSATGSPTGTPTPTALPTQAPLAVANLTAVALNWDGSVPSPRPSRSPGAASASATMTPAGTPPPSATASESTSASPTASGSVAASATASASTTASRTLGASASATSPGGASSSPPSVPSARRRLALADDKHSRRGLASAAHVATTAGGGAHQQLPLTRRRGRRRRELSVAQAAAAAAASASAPLLVASDAGTATPFLLTADAAAGPGETVTVACSEDASLPAPLGLDVYPQAYTFNATTVISGGSGGGSSGAGRPALRFNVSVRFGDDLLAAVDDPAPVSAIVCTASSATDGDPAVVRAVRPAFARTPPLVIPVVVLRPAWPLVQDVLIHSEDGADVKSAFAEGYTRVAQHLNGSCYDPAVCPSDDTAVRVRSALQSPDAVSIALDLTGVGAAAEVARTSLARVFDATVSGATRLTIVADAVFWAAPGSHAVLTPHTRVTVGGHPCGVVWASDDGRLLHCESPPYATVCGSSTGTGAARECGYHDIVLAQGGPGGAFGALVDGTPVYDAVAALAASSGNAATLPPADGAAAVSCPPFCPGQGMSAHRGGFPAAVALDVVNASYAVVTYAPARARVADASTGGQAQLVLASPVTVTAVGATGATYPRGLRYSAECSRELYTPPSLGVCEDATDPRSADCAFGEGDDCQRCPAGALCPGGYRLVTQPGYYASAGNKLPVVRCAAPAEERCLGWNATAGRVECGVGYRQGSYRCGSCAAGHYAASDGSCELCPASQVVALLKLLIAFLGALLAFGLLNYAAILLVARYYGGTVAGGAKASVQLMIWTFTVVQTIVQVGKAASPGLPRFLREAYAGLDVFSFGGLAPNAACVVGAYPFMNEAVVMGLALGLMAAVAALQPPWRRLCGMTPAESIRRDTSRSLGLRLAHGLKPLARRLLFTVLTLVYPIVLRSAMDMTYCAPLAGGVTVRTYLSMDGDGSSLRANNVTLPTDPLTGAPLSSERLEELATTSRSVAAMLDTVLSGVLLLVSNSYYVCTEGSHAAVWALGWATIVLYGIGYPAGAFLLIRRRINRLLREYRAVRVAVGAPDRTGGANFCAPRSVREAGACVAAGGVACCCLGVTGTGRRGCGSSDGGDGGDVTPKPAPAVAAAGSGSGAAKIEPASDDRPSLQLADEGASVPSSSSSPHLHPTPGSATSGGGGSGHPPHRAVLSSAASSARGAALLAPSDSPSTITTAADASTVSSDTATVTTVTEGPAVAAGAPAAAAAVAAAAPAAASAAGAGSGAQPGSALAPALVPPASGGGAIAPARAGLWSFAAGGSGDGHGSPPGHGHGIIRGWHMPHPDISGWRACVWRLCGPAPRVDAVSAVVDAQPELLTSQAFAHFTASDYRASAFYFRCLDMGTLFFLTCLLVYWQRTPDVGSVWAKLGCTLAVLAAMGASVLAVRPFIPHDVWKMWVRLFALGLAGLAGVLNCFTGLLEHFDVGGTAYRATSVSIDGLSYVVFLASLGLFCMLIAGFWYALVQRGKEEAEEIRAREAAAAAAARKRVVGGGGGASIRLPPSATKRGGPHAGFGGGGGAAAGHADPGTGLPRYVRTASVLNPAALAAAGASNSALSVHSHSRGGSGSQRSLTASVTGLDDGGGGGGDQRQTTPLASLRGSWLPLLSGRGSDNSLSGTGPQQQAAGGGGSSGARKRALFSRRLPSALASAGDPVGAGGPDGGGNNGTSGSSGDVFMSNPMRGGRGGDAHHPHPHPHHASMTGVVAAASAHGSGGHESPAQQQREQQHPTVAVASSPEDGALLDAAAGAPAGASDGGDSSAGSPVRASASSRWWAAGNSRATASSRSPGPSSLSVRRLVPSGGFYLRSGGSRATAGGHRTAADGGGGAGGSGPGSGSSDDMEADGGRVAFKPAQLRPGRGGV
jgi:hypothetical protein